MKIRDYTDSDFSSILNVYALSKLDELRFEDRKFDLVPLDEDPERLALFNASRVVVCEKDGIAGYASYCGSNITALFVHPGRRGRGIGKKLLEYILQRMEGPITLNLATSNEPAKQLYVKYGFTVVSEFMAYYNGIEVSASTMERKKSDETTGLIHTPARHACAPKFRTTDWR
jgi:putative acetyltransferase